MSSHASIALSLQRVTKSYGSNMVLREVDLEFHAGSVTALVGPNGAGKTTLLRIAAALQFSDSGRIVGAHAGYFGGFETLPVNGSVGDLWRALGLRIERDRRRLSRLSRGELQWIGVEAIFALQCRVVLLDEPWTGLEPDRKDDLSRRMIDRAATGTAVVCASHDLDEVHRIADRIYFIGNRTAVDVQERDHDARVRLLKMFREAKLPEAMS